ncbi:MAG: hypothetical protein Q8R96_18505 [Bacteroidota bacterium]|nr:hypothetical protein [Bacteroidota bacterium]
MKKQHFILTLILMTFLTAGCATYSIQPKSLVDQLKTFQIIEINENFQKFSGFEYPSNNLVKIDCQDKKGNNIWLYPDKNTEFIFIKKSTGKKVKAYFDTVLFQNDTLYGLRSRILGGLRIIPVNDIDKISIYSELPKTEPLPE